MAIFATLNPADKDTNITLSNGNLTAVNGSTGSWKSVRSTISVSTGKWYWETTINATDAANDALTGIALGTDPMDNFCGAYSTGWGYYGGAGIKLNNSASSAYGATFTTGDVIGTALDIGGGTVEMYKNGVSQGVMFTGLTGPMFAMPSCFAGSPTTQITMNFGATPFAFSVPGGYNPGLYTGTVASNSAMFGFF